ncbi:hypothetical protein P148_SR1C00001G0537 [candidate division SR1 bacterium RAAC1_SR1_1]|nr:hypothetical protein P148_SR1C00001G0537 [candidate division SR1 bacterium RAAC1_SR1_1]
MKSIKRTKIIATVSDINCNEEKLIDLYNAGTNIIRFNFSHAQQDAVAKLLEIIKDLNDSGKTNLSTLLDTKGPEIRTGNVQEKVIVKKGDHFKIFVDESLLVEPQDIFCDYNYLLEDVKKDQIIIIDSGLLKAKVIKVTPTYVVVEALNDHSIGSRRHVNLPGVNLKLPGITDKDESDILFAIEHNIDLIAASFIRHQTNVIEIKSLLKQHNAEHIQIISKIENQEALANLEGIVKESDGIMVARGDLGVEIEISTLPYHQKVIMDTCFTYGKTIIVATELLKSMVESPFPTRAEVSDVYNSVILRTDCTMLSDETAVGKFPIQSCQMMTDVILEAEQHTNNKHKDFEITFTTDYALDKKMIAKNALFVADQVKADYILLFTNSGFLARVVSAYKPNHTVFAFTKDLKVLRSMNFLFAIYPFLIESWGKYPIEDEKKALAYLESNGFVKKGQKIIVINDVVEGNAVSPYVKVINL